MGFFKSRAVAQRLGVPYYVLYALLRDDKLAPPEKDSSGDFVWQEADVERARAALAARRRPATVGAEGGAGQRPHLPPAGS